MQDSFTPMMRSCGGCTVCCQAPAIVPLGKACGERCVHLVEGGCGVYAARGGDEFRDCVSFRCLWLEGRWSDAERPDRIGAVFMGKDDPDRPGQVRVQVAESFVGAAEDVRVKALIREILAGGQTVAITNREYVVAILPSGDSWRYAIDTGDPLRGRVDAAIKPVRLTVAGRAIGIRGSRTGVVGPDSSDIRGCATQEKNANPG